MFLSGVFHFGNFREIIELKTRGLKSAKGGMFALRLIGNVYFNSIEIVADSKKNFEYTTKSDIVFEMFNSILQIH